MSPASRIRPGLTWGKIHQIFWAYSRICGIDRARRDLQGHDTRRVRGIRETEAVRVSEGRVSLAIETLDSTRRMHQAGAEPVQQQRAVPARDAQVQFERVGQLGLPRLAAVLQMLQRQAAAALGNGQLPPPLRVARLIDHLAEFACDTEAAELVQRLPGALADYGRVRLPPVEADYAQGIGARHGVLGCTEDAGHVLP